MNSLQIFLLGAPRFERDGQVVSVNRRKSVALAAYLFASGHPQSRDQLATLLWPEQDQSSARANLRRDLSRLKGALGDDVLQIGRDQVGIDLQGEVWLDVEAFTTLYEEAAAHNHPDLQLCPKCAGILDRAIGLYHDDFMTGFSLPDSPAFDEWQFFQAESLRQMLARALQQLIHWHSGHGKYDQAIEYGRRWLTLDPLHEPAQRQLMRLYTWSGRQAAALRQYEESVRLLAEELGVEPDEETTALYEAIRTRQLEPPSTIDSAILLADPSAAERYTQEDLLATGGYGKLYRGRDRVTGQAVVIKRLKAELNTDNAELMTRFIREGEALRQLNHPNIVKMLALIEEDGRYSLVMEYISGGNLRELLAREGKLPLNRALDIALELADALGRAHHLDIIHRDLKPDNVLLAEDGSPRLTDFGLARLDREDVRLTRSGALIGSPAYMSPEALWGQELDARSDIWSFGVLLYEMLAGQRPFGGDTITSIMVNILERPSPNIGQTRQDIPPSLVNLVTRLLVKDKEMRVASMRQVAAELEAIREGRTSQGSTPYLSPELGPPPAWATPQVQGQPPRLIPRQSKPHLPTPPTPFVSREKELNQVRQLIRDEPDCRLLTLLGPGGIGKTRLALQTAIELQNSFHDGVFFVPLDRIDEPSLIVSAIDESLHSDDASEVMRKSQLVNFFSQKSLLLILDNFEHLLGGAEFLSELLSRAPHVTLLVTSRERLNLQEEWIFEVGGLTYPEKGDLKTLDDPNQLKEYGAIALFLQGARRAIAGFELNAADVTHVIRICQALDGTPLGIELAAAWVHSMTCREIADEIESDLDFLSTSMRNIPERHRSLRVIFDQTWQRLNEMERTHMCRLAVFRNGYTKEAARAVVGASTPILASLVDKALLRRYQDGRYEMHEVLRQFALEKLRAQPDEFEEMVDRHSDYYANFVRSRDVDLLGDRQREALAEIAADLDNVRAAWQRAVEKKNSQVFQQATQGLWCFTAIRGAYEEGAEFFGKAALAISTPEEKDTVIEPTTSPLNQSRKDPDGLEGFLLAGQGYLVAQRGDLLEGLALMERGMSLVGRDSEFDSTKVAYSLFRHGQVLIQQGRFAEAEKVGQRSLELYKAAGNPWGMGAALQVAFTAAVWTGQLEKAKKELHESLSIASGIDNQWLLIHSNASLAQIHLLQGEFAQAKQLLEENLRLSQEIGHRLNRAAALRELSRILVIQGRYLEAVEDVRESLEAFKELDSKRDIALTYNDLAHALLMAGEYTEAATLFQRSLSAARLSNHPAQLAITLRGLGFLSMRREAYLDAKQYLQESLAKWQEVGNRPESASVLRYLGYVAAESDGKAGAGRWSSANRYFREALEISREFNLPPFVLDIFTGVAPQLADDGEVARALALLTLAEQHASSTFDTRERARQHLAKLADRVGEDQVVSARAGSQISHWRAAADWLISYLSTPAQAQKISVDWGTEPGKAPPTLTGIAAAPLGTTLVKTGRQPEQDIHFCTSRDGTRIAYAIVGHGPPLVKVGNPLTHLEYDWQSPVWRHWVEDLSQDRTLIRYDERGCGLSDWNAKTYSVDAWVEDLEAVVDDLGLERFDLLGLSRGSAIGIAYATRHPEKVSHLALYGGFLRGRFLRDLTPEQLAESEALLSVTRAGWGKDNPAFRQLFGSLFMPEATIEQLRWFADLARITSSPENALAMSMASYYHLDVSDLAPKVTTPTLVLHARGDAVCPFDEGILAARTVPGARFVPLESNNHILLEHEPAWQHFLAELQKFFAQNGNRLDRTP